MTQFENNRYSLPIRQTDKIRRSILMRRPFPADGVLEMTCPWECPEVKDTLMRIPNWPALVCGWMLAASIGQSVFAAPPAGDPSGGVNYAIEDDDEESFG